MKTLSISARLWLPVLALAALTLVLGAVAARQALQAQESSRVEQEAQLRKFELALRWRGLTEANAGRVMVRLISRDSAADQVLKADVAATTSAISELQKQLEALAQDPDDVSAMKAVADARKHYIEARNRCDQLKSRGDHDGAARLMAEQVRPAVVGYLDRQQGFVGLQERKASAQRELAAQQRLRTVWGACLLMSLVIALLALSTWRLSRSIAQPLRELVVEAERIGRGDLSAEALPTRDDEIGEVQRALVQMKASLSSIMGELRQSSVSLQTASAEIATGNADLSLRTEQTASNLQQAASAMGELTGTVRQSADSAASANRLAGDAAAVAERGGDVVGQVVRTMDEIHASAAKIGDIIGVIDSIAFQTNILALNAAVEAARAGEQGRGFAVVAGEVRLLAQRSATAAREIKTLISTSVDRAEAGARLVRNAGTTMNEIVASVHRVSQMLSQISASTVEQSAGLSEVNGAVLQLDQMTQQNAALVEQSAAATESLKHQAVRMNELLSGFKLRREGLAGA